MYVGRRVTASATYARDGSMLIAVTVRAMSAMMEECLRRGDDVIIFVIFIITLTDTLPPS